MVVAITRRLVREKCAVGAFPRAQFATARIIACSWRASVMAQTLTHLLSLYKLDTFQPLRHHVQRPVLCEQLSVIIAIHARAVHKSHCIQVLT